MSRCKGLWLLLGVLFLSGCMPVGPVGPVGPAILYEEDFNADANWYEGENDNKKWWIEDGKYQVLVKVEDVSVGAWNSLVGEFSNFQLDVDAEQIDGPDDNGYGIQFRVVDADNYYRFRISGDGWARFDKRVSGSIEVIREWERSALIHQGDAINHITVTANGSLFTFFINGTEDFHMTDTEFANGAVGFMVVLLGSPAPAHFAFDNLIITELE